MSRPVSFYLSYLHDINAEYIHLGGCQNPVTVGKQSIIFYEGTFINLHDFHCEP